MIHRAHPKLIGLELQAFHAGNYGCSAHLAGKQQRARNSELKRDFTDEKCKSI
jgi:hypothetical protein